jgi:hypothetical protein
LKTLEAKLGAADAEIERFKRAIPAVKAEYFEPVAARTETRCSGGLDRKP